MTDWVSHWKAAGMAGDAHAAAAALAPDAELISPITDQYTFRTPAQIEELLTSVFEVITDLTYLDDVRGDRRAVLFAQASIGTRQLQEQQHLVLAEDGRIDRVTMSMRPIPAVTVLARSLGPRVARRQKRPGARRVLTGAGFLLHAMATAGDRWFIPLARPGRTDRQEPRSMSPDS